MQSSDNTKSFATPRTAVALGCLSPGKQDRYTCLCCRVKFDSVELQRRHFKTEWHLYNLKRKVCFLEPIDANGFQQIQETNPTNDSDETSTNFDTSSYVDLGVAVDGDNDSDESTFDDDEWEKLEDDESFLDEDYTSEEVNEMLARMIRSDTCLFCDFKSTNIKDNVNHMNIVHGFFLPEEKYLIDLEGMIDYLGFKVGAGATCLWCNKQFTTLHGVRLHMLDKNHCKIFYDQDKAVEYKDYYDYAKQEQIPMRPLGELMITRKPRLRRYSTSPNDKSSSLSKQTHSSKNQLIQAVGPSFTNGTPSYKGIKKFNAERAKLLLKTEMANNKTIRGRFKSQNPI